MNQDANDRSSPCPAVVDRREARRMFGASESAWLRWQAKGWVRGTRVGRQWFYDVEQLNKLLAECGRLVPPYPDPQRPGCYRLPLCGGDIRRREAVIDAESLSLVEGKRWIWSISGGDRGKGEGFVALSHSTDVVPLRRIIMGVSAEAHMRVGHVNGDGLDCRRANLFVRTMAEQVYGTRKAATRRGEPCSSRFKGVTREKRTGRWRAQICLDGKRRALGRFNDEIAAAEAYDEAARELFGEHARLNFPNGIDAALATPTALAA